MLKIATKIVSQADVSLFGHRTSPASHLVGYDVPRGSFKWLKCKIFTLVDTEQKNYLILTFFGLGDAKQ